MKRNTKATIALLTPPVCLISAVSLYAIASFILSAVLGGAIDSEGAVMLGNIVRIGLGGLGIIGGVGIFTLWPYGLYLVMTDEKKKPESKNKS